MRKGEEKRSAGVRNRRNNKAGTGPVLQALNREAEITQNGDHEHHTLAHGAPPTLTTTKMVSPGNDGGFPTPLRLGNVAVVLALVIKQPLKTPIPPHQVLISSRRRPRSASAQSCARRDSEFRVAPEHPARRPSPPRDTNADPLVRYGEHFAAATRPPRHCRAPLMLLFIYLFILFPSLSLALCSPVFLFVHYARLSAPAVTFICRELLSVASRTELLSLRFVSSQLINGKEWK